MGIEKSNCVKFKFDKKLNTFIALMPDGQRIPHQISMKIEDILDMHERVDGNIYFQKITIECFAYFEEN